MSDLQDEPQARIIYACMLFLRRVVMTMPATEPRSRRMRMIELAVEIFLPTAYESGSKRIMSRPSPSGMMAPRRIQSARKSSTGRPSAVVR